MTTKNHNQPTPTKPNPNPIPTLLLLLTLLHQTACTHHYNRQWKQWTKPNPTNPTNTTVTTVTTATNQPPTNHNPILGPWQGTWQSQPTQHTGKLRCIITPAPNQQYQFHYWATWKIFAATHRLTHPVEKTPNGVTFTASKNLGKLLGGTYTIEGNITHDQFNARYRSRLDHGTLTLTRPLKQPNQ